MINIAFDIDGCVVNMDEHFRKILKARTGKGYSQATTWNLAETYNITEEETWDILAEVYMNPNQTPIIEGAREVLETIYNYNNKEDPIQFVTARPKWVASMTYSMLDRIISDIDYEISFSNHKNKYLRNYKYIVEDNPHNVEYFIKQNKVVFMPTYEYNKHLEGINLIKIYNIRDILEYDIDYLVER